MGLALLGDFVVYCHLDQCFVDCRNNFGDFRCILKILGDLSNKGDSVCLFGCNFLLTLYVCDVYTLIYLLLLLFYPFNISSYLKLCILINYLIHFAISPFLNISPLTLSIYISHSLSSLFPSSSLLLLSI